jgi:hypothetical protein
MRPNEENGHTEANGHILATSRYVRAARTAFMVWDTVPLNYIPLL